MSAKRQIYRSSSHEVTVSHHRVKEINGELTAINEDNTHQSRNTNRNISVIAAAGINQLFIEPLPHPQRGWG